MDVLPIYEEYVKRMKSMELPAADLETYLETTASIPDIPLWMVYGRPCMW